MATVKGKYNYISEILKGTESDDTFMAGSGNEYAFGDYGVDTGLFPYGNNLIISANYYVGFGVAVILVQGKINPIDVYYLDGIEILQTLDVALDLNKIDRLVCKEYGLPYNFIQTSPSSAIEGPWNEDLVYSDRFFNTFFPLGDDITIFGKTDAINRIYINYSSKNVSINQRDLSTTDIYSVLNGELLQHVNGKNLNSIITTDALYWRLPTSSTWEKWGAQEGFNLMKFDLLNNLLFSVTPSATTINEIGTLTTTIETINVASGTTLYYSLSGTGISTSDFSSGSLTGSGTVGSDGSFSFSHALANDLTTEGTETLNIKLFFDSSRSTQVGSTASVSIGDTSLSSKIKEVQSLSSARTPIRYQRNKELTVPINYSTSDGSSTTGLSFKVHFNSSLLSFDSTTGITNKTQADLFQIGATQQDTANTDNDATTDSFIPINIASFTGKFPTAGVPVKLADLIFNSLDKPIDPITGLKDTSINFTESEAASGYGFTATSASLKPFSFSLDVDGDGKVTALGDGLMVIRKLFGAAFAGDALINKAISPDSPYLNGIAYNTLTTQQKADVAAQVHANIQSSIDSKLLDVDKDGKTTALGDGLMVIRHLFGAAFAGAALTNKAISPDSPYFGTPVNFAAVATNIDSMRPV